MPGGGNVPHVHLRGRRLASSPRGRDLRSVTAESMPTSRVVRTDDVR